MHKETHTQLLYEKQTRSTDFLYTSRFRLEAKYLRGKLYFPFPNSSTSPPHLQCDFPRLTLVNLPNSKAIPLCAAIIPCHLACGLSGPASFDWVGGLGCGSIHNGYNCGPTDSLTHSPETMTLYSELREGGPYLPCGAPIPLSRRHLLSHPRFVGNRHAGDSHHSRSRHDHRQHPLHPLLNQTVDILVRHGSQRTRPKQAKALHKRPINV